eukprot:2267378-Ditylum_brightwellii.AAC.1
MDTVATTPKSNAKRGTPKQKSTDVASKSPKSVSSNRKTRQRVVVDVSSGNDDSENEEKEDVDE